MLTTLVTGNMIGSGMFLLPSSLAAIGSISLYSWIITAVGSILLAMVFAKLGHMMPKTGGPYAYAHEGFGAFIGFQTAYNYWIALWVGNAAIAVAMIGYLRVFFPVLNGAHHTAYAAIAVVWLLTFVNIVGVRRAGFLQVVSTVCKLIPILLIALLGWSYFHPEYLHQSFNVSGKSDFYALSNGAVLTLWAFIGLESATVPADSVENPKRNIPIATIVGTLLAAVAYIASSAAIMGMIPAEQLATSTSPFADAADLIFGGWGRDLIALGAAISCFGALNGWTLLQGQVAMAAAEKSQFPRIMAKRNRHGAPGVALFITAILVTVLLVLSMDSSLIHQFNLIILMATLASLLPYFFTAMSEIILLKQNGQWSPGAWKHVLIAIFAAIYSCWAILASGEEIIFYGMILLLSSIPLYAFIRVQYGESSRTA